MKQKLPEYKSKYRPNTGKTNAARQKAFQEGMKKLMEKQKKNGRK